MKHSFAAALAAALCCAGAAQADPPEEKGVVHAIGRTKPQPNPFPRSFSAEVRGDQIVFKTTIENRGSLATPEPRLLYKAEILAGKDWLFLASWFGDSLQPHATVDFEKTAKAQLRSGKIRFRVLGPTGTSEPEKIYSEKLFDLVAPLPVVDLGITGFTGGHGAAPGSLVAQDFFDVTIKNFGPAPYIAGRGWNLYVKSGSKWQFVSGGTLGVLKAGDSRTINLLPHLDTGPSVTSPIGRVYLYRANYSQPGTSWKVEIATPRSTATQGSFLEVISTREGTPVPTVDPNPKNDTSVKTFH